MAPEALVTIFSIAIAVFALLPPERRLDLQVRLSGGDYAVLVGGLGLVHYILFYPVLAALGLAPDLGPWRWGFTPETASYLTLAAMGGYASIRARLGRLGRRRIRLFQRLTESLLHSKQYAKLTYLLRRHLPRLIRIRENRYLLPSIRDRMEPPFRIPGSPEPASWRDRSRRRIARMIPTYSATADAASATLHRILLSDHFVKELASIDPYLGLEVLARQPRQADAFQDVWLNALLDDSDSVLYYEIESNQNLRMGSGSYYRYHFYPENRLLHFYFDDVRMAQDLGLYKPIGDYFTNLLDELQRSGAKDRYNQRLDDYHETDRWRCPAHAILRLFEFMVSEALYQNVTWHMWLYYFTGLASQIERNLDPADDVDLNAEWPTPYHFMLYEMVSLLTDWVRGAAYVPKGQTNATLESVAFDHENGNIPKSSILALANVSGTIFGSASVGERFKTYVLEMLLRCVENLRQFDHMHDYADLLLEAVARGQLSRPTAAWAHKLEALVDKVDLLLRMGVGQSLVKKSHELAS